MTYRKSIQQSLDFIERELDSNMKSADIAKEVGYSVYHFHRLFLAIVGTTIADYVRRRRLTESALSLLESKKQIIQIALDFQFETQESFTRAFKKLFGTTPAKYRKQNVPYVAQYQFKIEIINSDISTGEFEMDPNILEKDEFKVIGLSKNYVFKQPNDIPELWNEFNRRENEIKNIVRNGKSYGLCIQADIKSEDFEYLACVEVSEFEEIPLGMSQYTIAANKYVVFTARGVQNIQSTFEFIYGKWLKETGYKLAESPDFELYDERFDPTNPLEGEVDIYVPVRRD